jgi:cytochrome P450
MTNRPVIDFDHHSPEFAARRDDYYQTLLTTGPAWSEHYGGFWVIGRFDDVGAVARDPEAFSVRHDLDAQGTAFTGIQIPPSPFHLTPLETDPPRYAAYRRLLAPFFSPSAIKGLAARMGEITDWCLDQVITTGQIDFVKQLANPMPAMDALELVGLPLDGWERFAIPAHEMVATPPDSPEHARWAEESAWIFTVAEQAIADRRAGPRDDLISQLITGSIEGEPIAHAELVEIISIILFGGLETTTGLIAFAIDHLDQVRADRQRLLDDRTLVPRAMEEFLRWFAPNQTEARTATRDVEIGGQLIREQERVLVCWAAANRDPAVFERPDEILIDRAVNGHSSFGLGPHRCLGSHFARLQSGIVLNRLLDRLPDYALDRDSVEPYPCIGTMNGYRAMPGQFTPGSRSGAVLSAGPVTADAAT